MNYGWDYKNHRSTSTIHKAMEQKHTSDLLREIAMKLMREIKRISDLPEYDFDHSTMRRDMQVDTIVETLEGCAPELLQQVEALTKENELNKITIKSKDSAIEHYKEYAYDMDERNKALTEQVEKLKEDNELYEIQNKNITDKLKHQFSELSRLRDREQQLVEALREAMPIVEESISEYERLIDKETFQEAVWAMSQVKEQTEQTLSKIVSLLNNQPDEK
jgi:chromosome segregation ATPase